MSMCHIVRHMGGLRVGVRELRQNLSVYLRRVKAGEVLEVTERGRPVALVVPLAGTAIERLVASGRAILAEGSLAAVGAPTGTVSSRLSDELARDREERL